MKSYCEWFYPMVRFSMEKRQKLIFILFFPIMKI